MKKMNQKKNHVLLKERIDFINVLGDTSHINHSTDYGFQKLKDYFCLKHGFNHDRGRRDVIFYSPKGARTIVVEFTRNRQNGSPIIKVKFPGSFLYGCQKKREGEIRNFISTVWSDLGIESLPYTNEFDVAVDTLGATFEEIGIDLNSPKWILKNKRSRKFKYKVHPHHNNLYDHCEKTGQTVIGTRFKFRWYDRQMALDQKYNGEDYKAYRDYYKELYESFNRVLREEVKLKKELCDLFNLLFWGSKKSFSQTLPHCLALFIKNHQFIKTSTGKSSKRLEHNFYITRQIPLKEAQAELSGENDEAVLRTLKYNSPKYNKKILFKKLALAQICEKGNFLKDIDDLVLYARDNFEFFIDEHILNLSKSYQTNMLLAQGDEEKRTNLMARFHSEKIRLLRVKNEMIEQVKNKKEAI